MKEETLEGSFTEHVLRLSQATESDHQLRIHVKQLTDRDLLEEIYMAISGNQNMVMMLIGKLESKGVI